MQVCPRCGTVVNDGDTECAWCKTPLATANPSTRAEVATNRWPVPRISPRSWLSLFLLAAGCLAIAIAIFAVMGVYRGTRDRTFENRRAAVVHYQKGLEYLRADRKELAAAEFREAVRLVPDFSAARQALEVVEDLGGDIQSIPTLTPAPDVLATLFAEGKSFYAAGRWPEAARKLEELVGAAPNYRAAEVEAMLFDSHMQAGLAAVEADQWDEALRQFDQALAIRPNDSEALRQRGHAEIYREGAKAWGSEWDRAVLAFNRLHELAPGYHDVGSRLREARVQYGNVFYSKRIWCQAEDQYREAIQIEPGSASSDLQERATDAGHRCEAEKRRAAEPRSTPTPSPGDSAPPDATIPAGEFVFVAAGPVAPAFDLGCSGHYIFGEVRSAANELLAGVRIQAVDQWGNVYANASKGPPEQGQYDIPIGAQATTYQVTITDDGGVPLSASVTVTDTGQFVEGAEACWHRLDWARK